MTSASGEKGTIADPYVELDEMHKLVEDLKAARAQLQEQLAELRSAIDQHHKEVFK